MQNNAHIYCDGTLMSSGRVYAPKLFYLAYTLTKNMFIALLQSS